MGLLPSFLRKRSIFALAGLVLTPGSAGRLCGRAVRPTEGRGGKDRATPGTPVVGGVSATDERLRPVPGARIAADARPRGRPPAPHASGAARQSGRTREG